ncbi:neprilysin-1-like [Drosophila hydei]|uniref:Neprilysin-1-like n=1 Tax=Drosophila hydei TaxID=7224 RepID=A0A6J1M7E0_DROHY|nr:neprilysin-1-like [Drosophila hydei]
MECRRLLNFLLLLMLSLSGTWLLPIPHLELLEFDASFLAQVLRNVNASVDPCEDFYGYACGNWSANYKDTKSYLDMPGYMDYKYNAQLLNALERHSRQGGIYDLLWAYYVACRDLAQPALNELLHLLEPQLGLEWPIFKGNQSEPWRNETQFDWLATLAKLRIYGLNGVFIKQDVNVRRENGSHYVLLLAPQPADAFTLGEQEIQDLYVDFGLDEPLAQNLTAKLMQLEWRLGNITHQVAEQSTDSLPEWTLAELQQRLPQINWRHYLTELLNADVANTVQLLQVSALSFSYLEQLQLILAESSNETICYYLMFKLLYVFNEELPPTGSDETRSTACVLQLRGHMPLAMIYLYEQHYYNERRVATDAALQRLQLKLTKEFEQLLNENYLQLNALEQAYVLEELHSLRLKIGNMPPALTMAQLTTYYKDLQLQHDDFYGNKLQVLRFYQRLDQQLLTNQPGIWPAHEYYQQDAVVARSSSPVKIFQNAVLLPHGYLQLPLYDARLSDLLQHAQLGFILAHELQHAFDLFHIVYDGRGNYNLTGMALIQHFANFTSCYTDHNAQQLLLSESMSDIVGLRLAFASYFNHVQPIDRPPVGNYTQQQLFFINSVQFLCANMQEITDMSITNDAEHGLHNERVNRNWPHHEQFANAFNCAAGQAMYQAEQCRLW